jgi:hypothetical protein
VAKKIRRVRTFARTASKSMEKRLVENAKKLKQDPYLILPDYEDNYSRRHFDKIKKSLDKVSRFGDDTNKLEKLSNKKGLDGALAGSILIAHSEKAPYLAVAKYPTGDITYAQRGRADKEKLIAVQHFDDPVLRLLGIKDIALKRNLHVYSWDEGFISTGAEANPPEEFINFLVRKTGFTYKNGVAYCGDIKPEMAKNKELSKKSYLRIHWKSADLIVAICEDCTKSKKNTIFNMTKYLIEPNISNDFSIEVIGQVVKQEESAASQIQKLDEYLSGDLSDYDFIKTNMQHREQTLKDSGEKIFILNGDSYGQDMDEFINALKPNKFEREGLELILEQVDEPVVVDNVTSNKVLERYWKDFGLDAIKSIIDDSEMAEKFFALDDTPSDILQLVLNFKERQKILSHLPRYKSLPPLAKFADNITRTYKTFGTKEAIAEIKKRPDNPKGKSIAYAFLLAFGKGSDTKWQYSQVEIEYGAFLKDYAKKLLDAKPENYHKALQELLTNSGASENIESNLA